MPFVNKPQCKKCVHYTEEHINRYWCKCSKTCTLFKEEKEEKKEIKKEVK